MSFSSLSRDDRFRGWALLVALQALVAGALLHDYLSGQRYFAFIDIGSDTFAQYVPQAMHLASPGNWLSAWSFNVGLGAIAPMVPSPFMLLGIAGGADQVLALRIWVYLAKIFLGGAAFYGFALSIGTRRGGALIVALAYSFCGHAMTDGQWDSQSTEFATYPLILWALAAHGPGRPVWPIPLSIAFAAYNGIWIFSAVVFIAYVFIGACVASDKPRATARRWLASHLPLAATGFALSAPMLLPAALQMLDSPRVTGAQSAFAERLRDLLNDQLTVLFELAGFFHKNLLGVGSEHVGWMNYLEGPGFYVGTLALLLIPQLFSGSKIDRRIGIAGIAAIALFVVTPLMRSAAFGFGLDYFRVNNLWVSMLLLTLFARALEVVARQGVERRMLGGAVLALVFVFWNVQHELRAWLNLGHAGMLAAFGIAALALLALMAAQRIEWRRFVPLALALVAAEAVVINYPSFHARREPVTLDFPGFRTDGTVEVLAYLKSRDTGFYRVEKTYRSVSLCDAMGQDYMGVKSYWFHGAGVVRFFMDLELIPRQSPIKNFTNWLPNFDQRYALNTLVGVKYVISKAPLDWAGFQKIHQSGDLLVYENQLALPLGVVQAQQIPREQFSRLSPQARDFTLINAAVVDSLRGSAPALYDPRQLVRGGSSWLEDNYAAPARQLKARGLQVEHFSPGRIRGRVTSDAAGILVFSIPFSKGWSVTIDGVEQRTFVANLGMLATDISAGTHEVELRFSLPGFVPGVAIAIAGLMLLLLLAGRMQGARPGPRDYPASA